jgi:hypothetical protein
MMQFIYKDKLSHSNSLPFLSFLQIIELYPFPAPSQAGKTIKKGWADFSISAFTDKKILKLLDPSKRKYDSQMLHIVEGSGAHLQLCFTLSSHDGSGVTMANERDFLTQPQIKEFFVQLVVCEPFWAHAACHVTRTSFYNQHFNTLEIEQKTMLADLNYFGKEELEKRGGFAAFESNPYLQTQRIHDGLLVQVGESPDAFDTPEGEQLLVNAINALPPLKV